MLRKIFKKKVFTAFIDHNKDHQFLRIKKTLKTIDPTGVITHASYIIVCIEAQLTNVDTCLGTGMGWG